jgi:hypothetical protein
VGTLRAADPHLVERSAPPSFQVKVCELPASVAPLGGETMPTVVAV